MKLKKEIIADAMQNLETTVSEAINTFREKMDLDDRREYQALTYVLGAILAHSIQKYHRGDVDLDDFTQFLSAIRKEFKEMLKEIEDEDENPCSCGKPGCKPVATIRTVPLNTPEGQELLNAIKKMDKSFAREFDKNDA